MNCLVKMYTTKTRCLYHVCYMLYMSVLKTMYLDIMYTFEIKFVLFCSVLFCYRRQSQSSVNYIQSLTNNKRVQHNTSVLMTFFLTKGRLTLSHSEIENCTIRRTIQKYMEIVTNIFLIGIYFSFNSPLIRLFFQIVHIN